MRLPLRLAAPLVLPVLLLTGACGSGDDGEASPTSSQTSPSASSTVTATTDLGIVVTGGFGDKPTLTIPSASPPKELASEVLVEGDGPKVAKGQKVFVNYLGQTWNPKDGQPNVFDNSYDRGEPFNFVIGQGNVIPGWDNGMLGRTAGSRVLLAIPADQAYGAAKSEDNELAGEPLVFVVDVIASTPLDATADGTVVDDVPAGFPAVTSEPGKEPTITSVKGVTVPAKGGTATSALLLEGSGEPIEADRSLLLQLVQTDAAGGTQTQKTWGGEGPQLVPASAVLETITALEGARVGSRAVVVTPPNDQQGAQAVVVDIIGQV